MNRFFISPVLIAAAFSFLLFTAVAAADPIPIIQYQATDLIDTEAGKDLWEYRYFISYAGADTFLTNQGFTIEFALDFYSGLQNPPPFVIDWDLIVFQPDPILDPENPAPGGYDAVALQDNPSLTGFSVTFLWLGGAGTAPGSQPFTVNRLGAPIQDEFGEWVQPFEQISEGETVVWNPNVIPEPGTILLLASGLIAAAMIHRKKR